MTFIDSGIAQGYGGCRGDCLRARELSWLPSKECAAQSLLQHPTSPQNPPTRRADQGHFVPYFAATNGQASDSCGDHDAHGGG